MQYAFNTVLWEFPGLVPSYPLDEVIRRLSRIGYDGIEIGCAAPHALPPSLDRATAGDPPVAGGRGARAGQPAAGAGRRPRIHSASPLPEERAATVAHYCEVVDLAADLGAKLVLYIAGWQVFGTTRQEAWATASTP